MTKKVKRGRKKSSTNTATKAKLKQLQNKWQESTGTVTEIVIENYCDIEPEIVEWLWENKIPREGITMFVGDPETKKTFCSLYVAAQVTRGRYFPNCDKPTKKGTVLIISDEDSHSAIVKPRLMAADADLRKVGHIVMKREVNTIKRKEKESCITDLIAEIDLLEKKIKSIPDFRLLIIDTLSSYLGSRNINAMGDIRGYMDRLASLSYKYHFAVLIIHHFNKNEEASSQYRGAGSIGIRGAARVQWGFVPDPENKERVYMLRDKLNISNVRTGLVFRLDEVEFNIKGSQQWVGKCAFEDEVVHEDLQTFLNRRQKRDAPDKDYAEKWLGEFLEDGQERQVEDVIMMAKQYGIAEKTLRRATHKVDLKVGCHKDEKSGKIEYWTWKLKKEAK